MSACRRLPPPPLPPSGCECRAGLGVAGGRAKLTLAGLLASSSPGEAVEAQRAPSSAPR